jgi:K(+)-stimulated pyrophosphate-energized sodium pump
VALNPIIKFSTLFGLLAVEIAVSIKQAAAAANLKLAGSGSDYTAIVGVFLLAVALIFVWRSFYAMRIPLETESAPAPHGHTVAAK